MRHQFFGGPLNGKVILTDVVLGSETLRHEIPWEEYVKVGETNVDGVLDIIQWRARSEMGPGEYEPPNAPGGYKSVPIAVEAQIQTAIHGATTPALQVTPIEEQPQDVQDAAADLVAMLQANAGKVHVAASTEAPAAGDSSDLRPIDVEVRVDIAPTESDASDAPTSPEDFVSSFTDPDNPFPEVEYGDYGTLPGEVDFEGRRKKIAGFQMWKWGRELHPEGSSGLGKKIETGTVNEKDAKKHGFESVEELYARAEQILNDVEAGRRTIA